MVVLCRRRRRLVFAAGVFALLMTMPKGDPHAGLAAPTDSLGEIVDSSQTNPYEEKALSYFQFGRMQLDMRKALSFVLLPKSAVTTEERQSQAQFCAIMLAWIDFVAPVERSFLVERKNLLVTYWPIVPSRADS